MSYGQILYEKAERIATITLNRPDKMNAYSEQMVHEILHALADARDDEETRAVILTGAGRGFCSGGDISVDFDYPARYRGHALESYLEMRENMHALVRLLHRFDKPTIAAVNGAAGFGGGMSALLIAFWLSTGIAKTRLSRPHIAMNTGQGATLLLLHFHGGGSAG